VGDGDGGGGEGDADGGDGLGDGDGGGEGLGCAEGDGESDGLGEGESVGEALGDAVGVALQPPAKKRYSVLAPLHPRVTPDGCEYQSCMFVGSALTKRFITLLPTSSPYAVINPPPPFGAVLPTHTPTTTSGL
jgi:hypothetical protein